MQTTISVYPVQDGWAVQVQGEEPEVFATGGGAETYARRLAKVIARAGDSVRLVIRDLNGRMVSPGLRRR
jgi:hypothetical protein